MVKYNVEVAHIYVDQKAICDEQITSVRTAQKLLNGRLGKQSTEGEIAISVWLDDYNPSKSRLNVPQYIKEITKLIPVDYVCSEKLVAEQYQKFKMFLDDHDLNYFDRYLAKRKKLPCSLLTTMWYLTRLEGGPLEADVIVQNLSPLKPFRAQNIINILPKKFAHVETTVKKIFQKNQLLKKFSDRITTVFY